MGRARGRIRWLAPAVWAALLAGALPAAASEGEIALHPETWAAFETYRAEHRPGAFAVSQDGAHAGASLCRDARCAIVEQKRNALRECHSNGGQSCVVFAIRKDVRLAYRVMSARELAVCPLEPAPRIAVELVVTDEGTSHAREQAWLARLMRDDDRQWLGDHGTVMGVTASGIRYDYALVRHATAPGRDGIVCAGVEGGTLRLRLDVAVFIAREIPADSCLYRAVLGHELKHKALALALGDEFSRELEDSVNAALAAAPFVAVPEGESWRKVARGQLRALVDAARTTFSREESRRQLAIDSDAEYERVSAACPGEADRHLP